MKALTPRQNEVLEFLKDFIREKKFPPTIREIALRFAISVKAAYDHLKALEKKGVLRCDANRSRSLEILVGDSPEPAEEVVSVPLLGRVAAGLPLMAEANFDGQVAVPKSLLRSGLHFALQVQGDSMRDAGILDGDLALIRQQPNAENGQIVVAMVDDAVTLKRYYKESTRVRLQPENPAYAPLYTQNVRILGRLAGLLRSYS